MLRACERASRVEAQEKKAFAFPLPFALGRMEGDTGDWASFCLLSSV